MLEQILFDKSMNYSTKLFEAEKGFQANKNLQKRDLSLKSVSLNCVEHEGRTIGLFESYLLDSAFQPIFSLAHKRIVGYEALLRPKGKDGIPVSPAMLFGKSMEPWQVVLLDRLCRYIHAKNFMRIGDEVNWLFLNIAPYVMIHGSEFGPFFKGMLDEAKIAPHRVVVELVEEPEADSKALEASINYYRETGCLLAVDDFGAGHSNFERVWSMHPHIVKLEQGMITRAGNQPRIRQMLPGIVDLLHQSGSLVLVEGIETEEQAFIAIESDVDFVQGYFFAKPTTNLETVALSSHDFESLFTKFKKTSFQNHSNIQTKYEDYRRLFCQAVNECRLGKSLEESCMNLFMHESVIRCYLLDPSGLQIGPTIVSPRSVNKSDPRFIPLHDARSADWFRRHYLRRAVLHPEQLQVTRPYMSITGEAVCITLSVMFESPEGARVFCCDVDSRG
ncbi:EAL domain-containing protein [Desulforegula conservatrix]|uniref:EAL domain-containing protein n=1 Tax=Desulforegula conservatrix TaxID=153026 RepID=UPI00041DD213|nr:EAL domain-containing protein [Desulforegula conservatrix]